MKYATPLFAAALAIASAAFAQDKPPATRDELRACMNAEAALGTRRQAILERSGKMKAEQAAIDADTEALKAERQKLVEENASLDRFDRKLRTHNQRIGEARKSVDALKAEVDALNRDTATHNTQCGGISYRQEDRDAILKEREEKKN